MVQAEGGELLRRLIQGHLDQRSAEGPIRWRVVGEDGIARTHRREGCKRNLETRFGEVIVTRRGYGGRALDSVFPLDAELNLPPDKYSHGLCAVRVEEVVGGSFDEAVDHLGRAGGGQLAKRQTEKVSVHLSRDFDAFCAQPLAPSQASAETGKLLVISADGKGIVMHPNSLREATRKAGDFPRSFPGAARLPHEAAEAPRRLRAGGGNHRPSWAQRQRGAARRRPDTCRGARRSHWSRAGPLHALSRLDRPCRYGDLAGSR